MGDLKGRLFAPINWIVPNLIPEGLTILAGKPKIGKSWLVLGLALASSRGTEALGQFMEKREVLYVGLEDNQRRMQARAAQLLGPAVKTWPENMTVTHDLAPIDAGGLDSLEQWMVEHPDTGLIVIDTLGKVRGMKRRDEEPYQYDYRVLGSLQEFATCHRIAVIVVHHVRKSVAEDVLDQVSGTTGIAGAADTVIVLGETERGSRLYSRGRDVEGVDWLVEMDRETGLWSMLGDFEEGSDAVVGLRKRIVDLLKSMQRPLPPKEIADRLGETPCSIRKRLFSMCRATPPLVRRTEYGQYEPCI